MKTSKRKNGTGSVLANLAGMTLLVAVVVALAVPATHAATIFSDNFDGLGTDNLNGTTPDITTGGATWVANADYKADGSVVQTQSSATLAFTPSDGLIYTLDASFGTITDSWLALGFAAGQSTAEGSNDRFITGNVIGKAWSLVSAGGGNQALLGSATYGADSGVTWTDTTLADTAGGNLDVRIVLDTTGGASNWTSTWYAKTSAATGYTEVRATEGLIDETISSVGFAANVAGGQINSFSLTSVPEPASLGLFALVGGLLWFVRRKVRA